MGQLCILFSYTCHLTETVCLCASIQKFRASLFSPPSTLLSIRNAICSMAHSVFLYWTQKINLYCASRLEDGNPLFSVSFFSYEYNDEKKINGLHINCIITIVSLSGNQFQCLLSFRCFLVS